MKALLFAAGLALAGAHSAGASVITLTDSMVFSSNSLGHNYIGWSWNTRGAGTTDPANRWNLYYSSSSDPDNPTFLNSGNDASAEIAIALDPGIHTFIIYGEQTGVDPTTIDDLHAVLNLSFNGMTTPQISGLTGPTCPGVCAASHPNGLDYLGNPDAPEAGTLSYSTGGHTVTLTEFDWATDDSVNLVWDHYAGLYFGSASPQPDWVGAITLQVAAMAPVPLPAAGWLLLAGLGAFGAIKRRRRL